MNVLIHIASLVVSLVLFVGVPLAMTGQLGQLTAATPDVVSSATHMIDAPSGNYVIFLNAQRHTDPDVRQRWMSFLKGQDTELIMEDLSCVTCSGDPSAHDLALSLQSRLAENQMTVRVENPMLALSKAEHGYFDVLVLSSEAAEQYNAETVENLDFVEVVRR
ncbi:MAG: hypothetical protein IJ125_03435 [Atopobiaceae bacterium]|nr:hypothetical protein [Atopobiaceae bacterium]